ncbi:MAG: uracil-DNA glycosylase [Verrucomicrobiota bacterium]
MADLYDQLLDATIQHLRDLKAHGVRHVPVASATLDALKKPVAPARAAAVTAPKVAPAISAPSAAPRAADPAPKAKSILPANLVNLDPPAPAASPLSREAKEQAIAELRGRALVCQKCPNLASSRTQVVFGVGDIHSPLMFVGEAPGEDEDKQGEPFVGKAGQLLTRIIQTMGLSRDTVYIANILKCRPDMPDQAYGNRKPTPEEMKTCLPYLLAQIDLIRPRVIVALGATAVEGLFGKANAGITKQRGNWMIFRDTPVMPTYHPAYLLRNQALSEKRRVWEDMLQVMERLGMTISEKQRGYFLKG